MPETDRTLAMYLHLARASQVRRQPMVRDKLLVLAGVQAQEMGLDTVAADCREKVLAHNGRHLVRQWETLDAALADERFQTYLKQLKRRYSPEKAEHMLASLGIEMGRERAAYFSDLEYASALLDAVPQHSVRVLSHAVGERAAAEGRQRPVAAAARSTRPGSGLRELLIVWGPLLAGLVVLAVVAAVARIANR